jgi:hypothetical protein
MWYKLRNKDTNSTMFYDELSDYLFWTGWRIEREAKASEVDVFDVMAVEHDLIDRVYE